MSIKSYITPLSIENLTKEEIYNRYKEFDAFIGDTKTVSYINKILKKYKNGKKN